MGSDGNENETRGDGANGSSPMQSLLELITDSNTFGTLSDEIENNPEGVQDVLDTLSDVSPLLLSLTNDPELKSNINYICPSCGGAFHHWEKEDALSVGTRDRDKRCPFCGTKKGSY